MNGSVDVTRAVLIKGHKLGFTVARSKGHSDPGVRHDRAVEIGQLLRAGYFTATPGPPPR